MSDEYSGLLIRPHFCGLLYALLLLRLFNLGFWLVFFSFRCGFGGGLVDLPVSDEDEEELEDEMDDGDGEGGGGSSKKKANQHVEQLKRLQQKVCPCRLRFIVTIT